MATVEQIIARKGRSVFTISPHATVLEAARLMNQHKIGSLVVLDHDRVQGIFTERDVLTRIVAQQRDPATTFVSEVMTTPIATCTMDTTIQQARSTMMQRRIRHLPVIDADNRLEAIVSIGDLNAWQLNGQEMTIQSLQEYIYGQASVAGEPI